MDAPAVRSWPLEDKVLRFLTDPASYSARTRAGLHLRILRARTFQPEVGDEQNYPTFLWLDTTEGCFLLRQHLVGHRALPWFVVRRVVPVHPDAGFFSGFFENLADYVRVEGLDSPYEGEDRLAFLLPGG